MDQVKKEVTSILTRAQLRSAEDVEAMENRRTVEQQQNMQFQHAAAPTALEASDDPVASEAHEAGQAASVPFVRDNRKIGRNEPCPCGSGKKYKRCHGQLS